MLQDREYPNLVKCNHCTRSFDWLASHLRVHKTRTLDYRKEVGIDNTEPLHSQNYHNNRKPSANTPENKARMSQTGKNWQQHRRLVLEELGELLINQGTVPVQLASELTGIPKQTLNSAIQNTRLSAVEVTPVILINNRVKAIGGWSLKAISINDLRDFKLNHRPKV